MNVQDLAPSAAGALYGPSHFILHNCANVSSVFLRFNLVFFVCFIRFYEHSGSFNG